MNDKTKRIVSILLSVTVSLSSVLSAVAKEANVTITYGTRYQFPIFMIDGKRPDTIETIIRDYESARGRASTSDGDLSEDGKYRSAGSDGWKWFDDKSDYIDPEGGHSGISNLMPQIPTSLEDLGESLDGTVADNRGSTKSTVMSLEDFKKIVGDHNEEINAKYEALKANAEQQNSKGSEEKAKDIKAFWDMAYEGKVDPWTGEEYSDPDAQIDNTKGKFDAAVQDMMDSFSAPGVTDFEDSDSLKGQILDYLRQYIDAVNLRLMQEEKYSAIAHEEVDPSELEDDLPVVDGMVIRDKDGKNIETIAETVARTADEDTFINQDGVAYTLADLIREYGSLDAALASGEGFVSVKSLTDQYGTVDNMPELYQDAIKGAYMVLESCGLTPQQAMEKWGSYENMPKEVQEDFDYNLYLDYRLSEATSKDDAFKVAAQDIATQFPAYSALPEAIRGNLSEDEYNEMLANASGEGEFSDGTPDVDDFVYMVCYSVSSYEDLDPDFRGHFTKDQYEAFKKAYENGEEPEIPWNPVVANTLKYQSDLSKKYSYADLFEYCGRCHSFYAFTGECACHKYIDASTYTFAKDHFNSKINTHLHGFSHVDENGVFRTHVGGKAGSRLSDTTMTYESLFPNGNNPMYVTTDGIFLGKDDLGRVPGYDDVSATSSDIMDWEDGTVHAQKFITVCRPKVYSEDFSEKDLLRMYMELNGMNYTKEAQQAYEEMLENPTMMNAMNVMLLIDGQEAVGQDEVDAYKEKIKNGEIKDPYKEAEKQADKLRPQAEGLLDDEDEEYEDDEQEPYEDVMFDEWAEEEYGDGSGKSNAISKDQIAIMIASMQLMEEEHDQKMDANSAEATGHADDARDEFQNRRDQKNGETEGDAGRKEAEKNYETGKDTQNEKLAELDKKRDEELAAERERIKALYAEYKKTFTDKDKQNSIPEDMNAWTDEDMEKAKAEVNEAIEKGMVDPTSLGNDEVRIRDTAEYNQDNINKIIGLWPADRSKWTPIMWSLYNVLKQYGEDPDFRDTLNDMVAAGIFDSSDPQEVSRRMENYINGYITDEDGNVTVTIYSTATITDSTESDIRQDFEIVGNPAVILTCLSDSSYVTRRIQGFSWMADMIGTFQAQATYDKTVGHYEIDVQNVHYEARVSFPDGDSITFLEKDTTTIAEDRSGIKTDSLETNLIGADGYPITIDVVAGDMDLNKTDFFNTKRIKN